MALTIPRAGREYVIWTVTGAPEGAQLEVSVDDGATWHALTRDGDQFRALVAGPSAPDNPPGTVVLTGAGSTTPGLRLRDSSEIVIRASEHIVSR